MKLFVKVVGKDSRLKSPSWRYIKEYYLFSIDCVILYEDIGYKKDKYDLRLEGSRDDIESFINYLWMEGFKIKY